MKARALALALAAATPAAANDLAPFLPPAPPAPKIVRLLAPTDAVAPETIESFERASGLTVALDFYARGGAVEPLGYDLVILRGPAIAKAIAAGALAKLDRRRLSNVKRVQPLATAKLAAYDREGGYALAFGWSAFGLLYDAEKTPAAPVSFAQALGPRPKTADCAFVWPDARDETFLAAWRLAGLDPARAKPADVKSAGALIEKARGAFLAFAVPDEVGALAKGTACLGAGTEGEAAAVKLRGGDIAPDVRFAYPREGAPLALYAYALPRDAPSPDAAYRLLDALLSPEAAARDAEAAGLRNAEATAGLDELKRLTPEPVFDAGVTSAMQAEWKRLTAAK